MADERLGVLEEDPWSDKWPGAILPAEAIEAYSDPKKIKCPYPLISPFDHSLLRAARYELKLGDEANVGGIPQRIDENSPVIVLPPHQVAVVKTYEYLRLPRFLIARWNLRVSMVYEGLLWVGGPQVDPGWAGHLYCPIYNLAERDVYLKYKQPIFTMDFVRVFPTTISDKRFTPRRRSIDEHDIHRLKSAPFEELNRLHQLEPRFYGVIGIMLVMLTIIITAIGIIAASPFIDKLGELDSKLLTWVMVFSGIGIISFVLNVVILWRVRPRPIWGAFFRKRRQ